MFNLKSKCSAQSCGLWAQLNITKNTPPARSRPRALGEWCTANGNPLNKHKIVLQTAVKWSKNCVNPPQKLHLPSNCCFVGQKAATVHTAVMLSCLLNVHFTSATLKKACLTNQAHLQNTLKNTAGTEDPRLVLKSWPLWVRCFTKELSNTAIEQAEHNVFFVHTSWET